jgi:hypothetical protein
MVRARSPHIQISNSHATFFKRTFAFSRRDAPEVVQALFALKKRGRGECRVPGAPAAARGVENTRVSHHGRAGNTRHSRTQWF